MAADSRFAHRSGLEVAVIGMAGRFPGAADVRELWRNLRAGVEAITFFTDAELAASGVAPGLRQDPRYVPAKGYLQDADLFDADFFGIGPREAEILDPQHRLFLECAWEALEQGGYDPDRYPGWVGVYAGCAMSSYSLTHLLARSEVLEAVGAMQASLGNDKDFLATRTSYKLNLEGPSLGVQTACSTSLVAVHLACQALLRGECDMALAGGASIGVPLRAGYLFEEGGILSPDGHCRPFDADARGTVGGNGVAIVLLKKLDEALADGDTVHAVIKGSALNNDGARKIGFTAPRSDGQAKVIRAAHIVADVPAESIGYVEAHGTATELGDPVEIAALTQAFSQGTRCQQFCALGSVKGNLGHLDAAAGVTGLIKTVLALEHAEIPPSLHFCRPNPQIDFAATPFYVNTELRPWPAGDAPRRAGVSSFGIGGTNAHAVLEEAPPAPADEPSRPWQLLLLSARTPSALEQAESRLAAFLADGGGGPLADVAYTLRVGRRAFGHRRMLVCRDREEAIAGLSRRDPDETGVCDPAAPPRPIAFLLPGQGAQKVGMGADLYRGEPTFRQSLDACADLLRPHLGLDFREVLYPAAGRFDEAAVQLRETALAQPVLFAVEYALARLWSEWGIAPQALLGHSLGELVAACLAGVLRLEEALFAVARRGALLQALPRGAMLAVPLSRAEVMERLGGELDLAAVNGPSSCAVSGPQEAIARLQATLEREGVAARLLETSHAFHSRSVAAAGDRFAEEMARLDLRAPQIPYLSNVTGDWIQPEQATDPGYWREHLRRPVLFGAGLARLLAAPERLLLEVGPWGGLTSLASRHPQREERTLVLSSSPSPRKEAPGDAHLLCTLGRLWLAGAQPDWPGFSRHECRRRVPLPTYPFERRRYWIAAPGAAAAPPSPPALAPAPEPGDWFYVPGWKRALPRAADGERRGGPWLLLLDDMGFGEALAERLVARGETVLTALAGEHYACRGADAWTLDPRRRGDYDRLLGELAGSGRAPAQIVHLWTVDGSARRPEPLTRARGFTSLLLLAQAIGEQLLADCSGGTPLILTVVSDSLCEVIGEETLCPEKATLLGPVQVIPQEYPYLECRCFDLALPQPGSDAWGHLAARLVDDLPYASPDPMVCYRGSERWLPVFDRLPLPAAGELRGLAPEGCYLITGGLGGIGLVVARGLAQALRPKLVLTGRSPLPPRSEWESAIAAGALGAAKLRWLCELEELGATVLVAQADVADERAMRRVVADAVARFGRIHGVFHAAGSPGGRLIQRQTAESAAAVLAPKVEGTLVLDRVLETADPDFLYLFSSLRAFLGGGGQVDYCAANCFLEAFARSRSRRGRPTCALAWDGWIETGMAYDLAVRRGSEAEDLADGLSNREGWEALTRVLGARGLPQVLVSREDFPRRLEQFRRRRAEAVLAVAAGERREPADAHPRPALATPFVAPRDPAERALAEVWSQLLGIEPIGVEDNFFELGGDSVVSLQIVSRARQAGLRLTPRQVFQHPTIAALAAVAGAGSEAHAGQEPVTGDLPLTPIQHRFLAHETAAPHHFNQALLLCCGERLGFDRLERAVVRLLAHHDALRLRFARADAGWRQTNAPPGGPRVLGLIDLAGLPPAEQPAAVTAVTCELQAALDLERGPLCRMALLELGADRPQRLMWTIHHLAVDLLSWRILVADLETLYGSPAAPLPAKTTSYQEWAFRLRDHARSAGLLRESEHWLGQPWHRVRPLPVDHREGRNTWGSARTETLVLDREATRALTHEVPGTTRAQVQDFLLAALAQACRAWTGEPCLLVELEGLGRLAPFEDVDLSRTVGWFTTPYPVLLDLESGEPGPEADLRRVQERLGQVPGHGFGFGLLTFLGEGGLAERFAALPAAEVAFLYTGVTAGSTLPGLYTPAPEPLGPNQSPEALRQHRLDVTAEVDDGRLQVRFTYSANVWEAGTIHGLVAHYEEALRGLLRSCLGAGDARPQPWERPLAELDETELRELRARFTAIADVYPLSPVQDGLLFHTLYEPGSGVYVTHVHWTLAGDLDPAELKRAWARIVARHDALRTAFVWERLRRPLQVVLPEVDLGWEEHDWRGIDDQEERFAALLDADRSRGFELARPPLLRLHFIRLDDGLHRLVWAFHHLVLDGWAAHRVFGELAAVYGAGRRGFEPALPAPRPYRDYLAWLGRRDLARAEAFWRRTLAGFRNPVPLPGARPEKGGEPAASAARFRASLVLSPDAGAALRACGRSHQLTLNTLVQGAWALLLASHAEGRRDVVFGTVTSGRPESLPGAEAMVGLFINTLPVRVRIEPASPLVDWLRRLQEEQAQMREWEHTPLVEIHGWTEVPRGQPLFETLLVFESFPAFAAAQGAGGLDLAIVAGGGSDQNNFPLTLTIYPHQEIVIEIATGRRWYDEETVGERLEELSLLLARMAEQPAQRVDELLQSLAADRKLARARAAERRRTENLAKLKRLQPKGAQTKEGQVHP